MDKRFLGDCLTRGMSLDQIGERAGKHPSTVSYWLEKFGLEPNGRDRHAPKGAVDPDRLAELANSGASIRKIATELGAGYSTVRYWLKRLNLETARTRLRRESVDARRLGRANPTMTCLKHGRTTFIRLPHGGYRCSKCSAQRVSRRRRYVKRRLVDEAGGACTLCGYSRHPGALHFHHIDPAQKSFGLSRRGVTRSLDAALAEAQKCVLLCANCHAEVEAGVSEIPDELPIK
jgi:transposase